MGAEGGTMPGCRDFLTIRAYHIPEGVLTTGDNVIAVRIFSVGGGKFPGGLYDSSGHMDGKPYAVTDGRNGAFDAIGFNGGRSTGYSVGGVGWYRKVLIRAVNSLTNPCCSSLRNFAQTFTLGDDEAGKQVAVRFDGVYMNAEVWINGKSLGEHPYGYTTFQLDLTKHLNKSGA